MKTYTDSQIRSMSRDEVSRALTEDFLERDGDTFVRIRRSGRLGWEQTLPQGSAYSQKMLEPRDTEELLKSAYSHACDMIKAMDTPFRVNVNVSGRASWTDSKVVFVASDLLQDETMSVGQRLDAFTGYAVHEGCHLLYTDFTAMRRHAGSINQLVRTLGNIIEDEMIEIRLGEDKPGLANFLTAAKYHAFGAYVDKVDELGQQTNRLQMIVNAILSMVRYPRLLTPQVVDDYGRLLLRCRNILYPYPKNTEESLDAAEKIYQIIVDEYKDELTQEQENDGADGEDSKDADNVPQEQGGDHAQDGQDESSQESAQESSDENDEDEASDEKENDDKGSSKRDGQDNPSQEDKDGNGRKRQRGSGAPTSGKDDAELTEDEVRRMVEDDYKKIKEALESIASQMKQGLETKDIADDFKKNGGELALECEGVLERGKVKKSILFKAQENAAIYRKSLAKVRKHIPAVSRILRGNGMEYKTTLRGMRSGVMDPNKIAEAYQGVASIYMRESRVKADEMTIILLLDESGSMEGEKLEAARDTAVLFLEALKNVRNVSLYIYGYTSAGGKTILYRYHEPGYSPKHGLGSMEARYGTPTREAIAEAVARVPLKDDRKTLLVVVSDGEPNGDIKEVADEVRMAERKGVKVMGISIDDDLPESTLKKMYGNYIKFTDMTRLVAMLGKVLKKEVLENTTKRQTA